MWAAPTTNATAAPRVAQPPGNTDCLLTVIVPVFNEVGTIDVLLERLLNVAAGWQVVVVDDGSTDGTADRLHDWAQQGRIELLSHAANAGKGQAIRTALARAAGKFVVVQDADLELSPEDLPRLLAAILSGNADVVYGSRFLETAGRQQAARFAWRAGVRVLNVLVRLLYGVRITDEATCYKMFSTDTLRRMDLCCQAFEFCPEVTAKSARMGMTIREIAVGYTPRDAAAGKKIRYIDGLHAMATLWRFRKWEPRNAGAPRGTARVAAGSAGESQQNFPASPS